MKKKKELTASEVGKMGAKRMYELYPDHEPQRRGGRKGAQTKLKNDPDYFKKIRAIGIAKQKKAKEEASSPLSSAVDFLSGE